MVRHHIKKKKGGNAASARHQAEKEQLAAELGNLDRFAGSSDEESDDDGDDGAKMDSHHAGDGESSDEESSDEDADDDCYGITTENMKDETVERDVSTKRVGGKAMSQTEQSKESSDEDGSSSSDDDYKDDENAIENDLDTSKSSGMANAMTRLLGSTSTLEPSSSKFKTPKNNNPIVLSKTTTPLQRLQQKIKSEEQALRQKRRERRSENLTAMRLPLAPTAGMSIEKLTKLKSKKKGGSGGTPNENDLTANAMAIAHEIEAERTHRRIATRGVVALFNAISKHRQAVAAEAAAKEEEKARIREEGRASGVKRKSEGEASQMTTKHGFLDMIKSAASSSERGGGGGDAMNDSSVGGGKADGAKKKGEGEGKKEKSVGWSALKDDFMMNSKLKDWDKELSDDEDDDEEEQNEKSVPARKRVKA